MNNPKKHHYVPQCYLRRFSLDNETVKYFDKISKTCNTEKIDEFCQIEDLYYLKQSEEHYYIETKFFANDNEDKLGKMLKDFDSIGASVGEIRFNKDRRCKLTKQVVLQYMRTPKYRYVKSSNELNAYFSQLTYLFDEIFKFEVEEILYNVDVAEFHKNILVGNIKDTISIIANAKWELLYAGSDEFYTSDNPIAIKARHDMPVTYCDAIKYFERIYYPLNSKLLLYIDAIPSKSFNTLSIREVGDVEISSINSFIKDNAVNYIIYKNEFK